MLEGDKVRPSKMTNGTIYAEKKDTYQKCYCRECGKLIVKNALRVGISTGYYNEKSMFSNVKAYYYHPKCIFDKISKSLREEGYDIKNYMVEWLFDE